AADALDPRVAPEVWGEYLRLRGALHAKNGSPADAYHDFAQSASLLDLLGERYQSALSHLALGRLVAETGARSVAERHLTAAVGCDADSARLLARSAIQGTVYGRGAFAMESLGRDPEGPRIGLIASPRPVGHPVTRRLRMIAAVARQGFALCAAQDRPAAAE